MRQCLESCPGIVPWNRALESCPGIVPWNRALESLLESCPGVVHWSRALESCTGVVPWSRALKSFSALDLACLIATTNQYAVYTCEGCNTRSQRTSDQLRGATPGGDSRGRLQGATLRHVCRGRFECTAPAVIAEATPGEVARGDCRGRLQGTTSSEKWLAAQHLNREKRLCNRWSTVRFITTTGCKAEISLLQSG